MPVYRAYCPIKDFSDGKEGAKPETRVHEFQADNDWAAKMDAEGYWLSLRRDGRTVTLDLLEEVWSVKI